MPVADRDPKSLIEKALQKRSLEPNWLPHVPYLHLKNDLLTTHFPATGKRRESIHIWDPGIPIRENP